MRAARLATLGGVLSFRALFNWRRPGIYLPTMLGVPLFQIILFVYLGRYSRLHDDAFYVVGNAIAVSGMASVFGMTMAIANERYFGTLASVFASPAARVPLFFGRVIPVTLHGLVVSAFGFLCAAALFGFRIRPSSLLPLAGVVALTVAASSGVGMFLGSLGLRIRDVYFVSNVAYVLMLLVSGVNVSVNLLAPWLKALGQALPLTHGIAAGRAVLSSPGETVLRELGWAIGLGAAYALLAYAFFRLWEIEGWRRGSFDIF
jgi:ABC-2 type transport system permease protein